MPLAVSLDGHIVPPDEACVSVLDRGFLYGDSIYETIRTHGGFPFLLEEHLGRLEGSAARIGLELPWTAAEITLEVEQTVAAAANPESAVRLTVTRGVGPIGLDPRGCQQPTRVIIARPLEPLPAELYASGAAVIIAKTQRNSVRALDPAIKSGNFLNNIFAMREAIDQGAFEAIMLNPDGFVAEATQSNLFLVRRGELLTPDVGAGILRGITRDHVIRLAAAGGLVVRERPIFVSELFEADEAFLTSSLKGVLPIRRIGAVPVGDRPGPITLRMARMMAAEVEQFVAEQGRRKGSEP